MQVVFYVGNHAEKFDIETIIHKPISIALHDWILSNGWHDDINSAGFYFVRKDA